MLQVVFAVVYNGPANSQLYPLYSRLFGDGTLQAALRAVACDQLIYIPFCSVPMPVTHAHSALLTLCAS